MEFYEIDPRYIDYLRESDSNHIMKADGTNYKHSRKYIGVFRLNGFDYLAPLSSPKENKDFIKNENGIITHALKTNIATHLIITKNQRVEVLGKIKFSNMIPVPDGYYKRCDFNLIQDANYKSLIMKQYKYVNGHANELKYRHAISLYNQYRMGELEAKFEKLCPDYSILEKKCEDLALSNDHAMNSNYEFLAELYDMGIQEDAIKQIEYDLSGGLSVGDIFDKIDQGEYIMHEFSKF